MKCFRCEKDFPEKEVDESHDIPCYLFKGLTRKERKKQADKFGRHNLCKGCHHIYEIMIISVIIRQLDENTKEMVKCVVKRFAKTYFERQKGVEKNE